ncbi:helix-turn-helix domain-containing protein [Lentzea sp. NPDC059081]|uniref:helix-turn-helix domain-containing protein n=1 Tax=Lentzea sp. NPDC059081 TaxID=3346719 RepID=UPI0036BD8EDC
MTLHDLGAEVRRLRETTEPAAVGLPSGGRRARGVRREELAELAGVSADYVRRLEQGRRHPSAAVVNALARALRVGPAEYERLCALAGYAAAHGPVPREAGPVAMRLVERFADTPVFLCDLAWNVVAVNGAWMALGPGASNRQPRDWNVAWRTFSKAHQQISRSDDDAAAFRATLVRRLHSASLRHPGDESLAGLVDELRTTSRPFDELWRAPGKAAGSWTRAVFRHPGAGDIALDGNLLDVPGDNLLAVVLTAAPGSADADRLSEVVASATGPAVIRVGQPGPG